MITVNILLKGNVIYSKQFRNQPMGIVMAIILNDLMLIDVDILRDIYESHIPTKTYILSIHKTLSTWLLTETKPMVSMVKKNKYQLEVCL